MQDQIVIFSSQTSLRYA